MEMWLMVLGVLMPVAGLLQAAETRLEEPAGEPAATDDGSTQPASGRR